jgi:hypothetical protein
MISFSASLQQHTLLTSSFFFQASRADSEEICPGRGSTSRPEQLSHPTQIWESTKYVTTVHFLLHCVHTLGSLSTVCHPYYILCYIMIYYIPCYAVLCYCMWCSVVYSVVSKWPIPVLSSYHNLCSSIPSHPIQSFPVLCSNVPYCTALYGIVTYYPALHHNMLHCAVTYCIALYSTAL